MFFTNSVPFSQEEIDKRINSDSIKFLILIDDRLLKLLLSQNSKSFITSNNFKRLQV